MGYGFHFLGMLRNNNNRREEKWSERGRASGLFFILLWTRKLQNQNPLVQSETGHDKN